MITMNIYILIKFTVYKIALQMDDELEQLTIRNAAPSKEKRDNVAVKKIESGGK